MRDKRELELPQERYSSSSTLTRKRITIGCLPFWVIEEHLPLGITFFRRSVALCSTSKMSDPIARDYRTVVCPFIDVVDMNNFEYRAQDEGKRGGFDWELYYKRLDLLPEDLKRPTVS